MKLFALILMGSVCLFGLVLSTIAITRSPLMRPSWRRKVRKLIKAVDNPDKRGEIDKVFRRIESVRTIWKLEYLAASADYPGVRVLMGVGETQLKDKKLRWILNAPLGKECQTEDNHDWFMVRVESHSSCMQPEDATNSDDYYYPSIVSTGSTTYYKCCICGAELKQG